MKKLLLLSLLACLPFCTSAHIGSPGVTFEGSAGQYAVLVLITPPDVIPGTAAVDIYTQASGIQSIWGKPMYWFAGDEGTPTADEMVPVPGEPGHYRGMIWLMSPGTSGITVEVKGSAGNGTVLVPVMAVSTAQKEMPASLGWILLGLCVFLVILMVTIISVSVSDGLVRPDEDTSNVRRKRWTGAFVSAVILVLIVWGGKSWWDDWGAGYKRHMYKPLRATTSIAPVDGKQFLELRIDTTRLENLYYTRKLSFVIPDHGKLMHMFLVRAGSMDVFAHLHPQRKDSATYVTPLPPLPAGTYWLFADISRLSGFAETIPDTIEIKNTVPAALASYDSTSLRRDDTYFVTNPIADSPAKPALTSDIVLCGKPGVKTLLPDGSTAIWQHEADKPFTAGKLYELSFSIQDEQGKPAVLQPYLGMMGHAVVMKDDGSVYIHLHPVGNYSMASQQTMISRFAREKGPVDWNRFIKADAFIDSIDHFVTTLDAMPEEDRNKILMGTMYHAPADPEHPDHAVVKFPYAFPSPGHYRIWIQMKRNGKILNSAFDATVE